MLRIRDRARLRSILSTQAGARGFHKAVKLTFVLFSTTEAVAGGVGNGPSRPTSPVPAQAADVAIEIDEDPPEAADSEPLVYILPCLKLNILILLTEYHTFHLLLFVRIWC